MDPIAPFHLHLPARDRVPLIFTSCHSGSHFPPEFLAATRLPVAALRQGEDSLVDRLFAHAPDAGAPLLAATIARAVCDPNREPWELDPAMFADRLPAWVNTASSRVAAGLGTIARLAGTGEPIYAARLPFAEAERRVEAYWRPYHRALASLVEETVRRFGVGLLVDCHSMPDHRPAPRVDFVLGDLHGTSCGPDIVDAAESLLRAAGYVTSRNDPYAGGYIARHYGHPGDNRHALQIEVARRLYLDERTRAPTAGFAALRRVLARLIDHLAAHMDRRGG